MPDEKDPKSIPNPESHIPEPDPTKPENFLGLEKHHATYGRLLISQSVSPEKIPDLIDPAKPIGEDIVQNLNLDYRNYDPVTSGLSVYERTKAWESVIRDRGFDEAYAQWSGSLRSSFFHNTDEGNKAVISHFCGKNSDFKQEDIDSLYNAFCKSGSKITDFVNKALENPDLDFSGVEWLAVKLFGKNSGKVTHRLLELESSLRSDQTKTVQDLFFKDGNINLDRINNNLTDEEKEILGLLSANLTDSRKSQQPAGSPTQPTASQPPIPGPAPHTSEPDRDEVLPGTFYAGEQPDEASPSVPEGEPRAPVESAVPVYSKENMPTVGQKYKAAGGTFEVISLDPDNKFSPRLKVRWNDEKELEWRIEVLNNYLSDYRLIPEASTDSATPDATQSAPEPKPVPTLPRPESASLSPTTEITPPDPIQQLTDRVDAIQNAIDTAKRGEIPIDSATNLPFISEINDETIRSLEDLLTKTRTQRDDENRRLSTKKDDADRLNGN